MSFGGLILTNSGRNKIAAAVSENAALQFTHIQLGDGAYNGSYTSKTELSNMVMEIPVARVVRDGNEVIIDCDWDSKQAPRSFYLREIGIMGNGVLCYYDNAREGDAEFIDPKSEDVVKQKRFRFTVSITDDVNITTVITSGLYALQKDVDEQFETVKSVSDALVEDLMDHIGDKDNPHCVTKSQVGLDNVDNTADKDKPVSVAQQSALNAQYAQLTGYTDQAIADLIGGAPETLDTLKEVADAIEDNQTVVDALNEAIGKKASKVELDIAQADIENLQGDYLPKAGDASNTTATFSQASSRRNISTNEKLSTIFGKIAKWIADLKTVAFTGSYNDLSDRPTDSLNKIGNAKIVGLAKTTISSTATLNSGTYTTLEKIVEAPFHPSYYAFIVPETCNSPYLVVSKASGSYMGSSTQFSCKIQVYNAASTAISAPSVSVQILICEKV